MVDFLIYYYIKVTMSQYHKGGKPTTPTVLNVENSKLAISNGYTIPQCVRYFMFLKSKY